MNATERLVANLTICMESDVKNIIEKIWVDQLVEEFVKEVQPKVKEKLEELAFSTIESYYSADIMKDTLNINFNLRNSDGS